MALSCSYIPHNKKGEELKGFQTYRKELGYETASKVFKQVLSPSFQKDYSSNLIMDKQGVPTYDSVVKIPYIREIIGSTKLMSTAQKKYPYVDNTRENYQRLVKDAHAFNQMEENNGVVAIVSPSKNGEQIRVEIVESNASNIQKYRNQYSTSLLNQKIIELLGDLGVTVDLLEKNEFTHGYVDFSKASSIADGFAGLINIANGMEGELALSEEFSHLLIDMFYDTPLVQRSLNLLTNNEELVREILGDEYQRNLDYYAEHPNHDIFGNEVSIQETMAEEALGRVLQEKLKTSTTNTEDVSKPLQSLVNRFIGFIKRIFKGKDSNELIKAKNEVDTTMSELAKGVLTGTNKLKKEELIKKNRNAQFQHLSDTTDKIIQTLQHADEIERKRIKITNKDDVKEIKERVTTLEAMMTDAKKMQGLFSYAKWALTDLQQAMNNLDISGTLEVQDFRNLRHIKSVLDSYSGFIDDFHEVLDELDADVIIEVAGEEVNLRELWRNINDLYKSCKDSFKNQAFAAFSDFLAPIYDKSPLKDEDGNVIPLRDILTKEDFDISEFDRWVTSMGNSSSIILQLFDKAVKKAKDKIKTRTTQSIRDIWKLRADIEKRGITSFEWMFEKDSDGHKTGNYISEYNTGQFEKDKKKMMDDLEEKYGKHPVGENYKKAYAERKAWFDSHAKIDFFGRAVPNSSYKNPAYARLTQAQKDTLKEILDYKDRIEAVIPQDRRNRNRAIQRRRAGSQRLADIFTNTSQAYESIKADIASSFKSSEDDDQMYGETTKGLTDFTGQEYLTLPILYTGRLKNPDTLSTDIFGDLMCYSFMANSYVEMSKIYDPLEIGVDVVSNKDFIKNSGSKVKEEVLNVMGRVSKKSIKIGSNTNFAKKLRDYLECQVYGKYMKEDDVVGKNTQKTIGMFQRLSSMAYLGCNYLAGIANVATAVGMQNIEAAGREFFSASELLSADKEYGKMLPSFIAELTSREKQSELALFDELFNVRQNAKDKLHNVQMKNIFRRFFGNNWLFVQQGLGDHWIYNRTAIAMAKHKKVKVGSKIMSVWDAREIITDRNGYKIMRINPTAKEVDENGKVIGDFDANDFARTIAHINHTIAGIYNDDDQNAANRVMIGRLAQQMRKWIVPQMMRRFQSKRMILDIGKEEEGYYRTFARLAYDLWKSDFKLKAEWSKLNNSEKANIWRAITEMGQTSFFFILVQILGSGVKDPDRHWAIKFAEYMANRELHELGFLTPSPLMLTEGYKTVTSPFVAASAANKVAQALLTTINPSNWFPDEDELIKSGRYEGHSYIYKRWMELPLPPMTQFRQIEKFIDDLDTGTKYYSRDYK